MKNYLFSLLLITTINTMKAQDPEDSISDFVSLSPFEVADSMMSQLDFSSITTNLLLDRSMQYTPLKGYDGSSNADTLYENWDWNHIYNSLRQSELSTGAGPPDPSNWISEAKALAENGTIPLRSLHYNYHAAIEDSAALYELITWDGNYFQDVPNRPTSPWLQKTVFAAGPLESEIYNSLSVNFDFQSSNQFGNTGKTIS